MGVHGDSPLLVIVTLCYTIVWKITQNVGKSGNQMADVHFANKKGGVHHNTWWNNKTIENVQNISLLFFAGPLNSPVPNSCPDYIH